MASFSTFTLEALVQIISGGPGLGNTEPPIGIYRSGPEIDGFLMGVGIDPAHGAGSRLQTLRETTATEFACRRHIASRIPAG